MDTAFAQDELLYCNHPERIRGAGIVAEARLEPHRVSTIFFHFRNQTGRSGPLRVEFSALDGGPLELSGRKGVAHPRRDPPAVGRQAMARLFRQPERIWRGANGRIAWTLGLRPRDVASGVMVLAPDRPARMRIRFSDAQRTAPGMRVVRVPAPRHDIEIPLRATTSQVFRIGRAEAGSDPTRDGAYGNEYRFRIDAPVGERVRISFSPRGGKAGLVGVLGNRVIASGIVPARSRRTVALAVVGEQGLVFRTSPFGGVFYPVELRFDRVP
ncbi:MAG: hypothetical protein ACKO5K_01925 [Armatimonadota bacterium]